MSKKLTIKIEAPDRSGLLRSKYLLCIAKSIDGETYDIVWRAFDNYLENNIFSWTPDYTLLITNSFTDGEKPRSMTPSESIAVGQQTTLNNVGVFSSPKTGQYPDSFEVINDYGNIHPGVAQSSTGIDNETCSSPIYISQNSNVTGTIRLKPIDKLLVWFWQGGEMSLMFSVPPMVQPTYSEPRRSSSAQSFAYEVGMTNSDTTTICYEDGKWSTSSGLIK